MSALLRENGIVLELLAEYRTLQCVLWADQALLRLLSLALKLNWDFCVDGQFATNRSLKQLFLARQVEGEQSCFLPTLQISLNTSVLRALIQDVRDVILLPLT